MKRNTVTCTALLATVGTEPTALQRIKFSAEITDAFFYSKLGYFVDTSDPYGWFALEVLRCTIFFVDILVIFFCLDLLIYSSADVKESINLRKKWGEIANIKFDANHLAKFSKQKIKRFQAINESVGSKRCQKKCFREVDFFLQLIYELENILTKDKWSELLQTNTKSNQFSGRNNLITLLKSMHSL